MIKKTQHDADLSDAGPQKKKFKKEKPNGNNETTLQTNKMEKQAKVVTFKPVEKNTKKTDFKSKPGYKNDLKSNKGMNQMLERPEDWGVFKKQKKELRIKRRESKTCYDVMVKAKKIGEKLRRKTLQGGKEERTKLVNELHGQLKGKGHYVKFVLTHDMARIIQYLLKFGSENVRKEISEVRWILIIKKKTVVLCKICSKTN